MNALPRGRIKSSPEDFVVEEIPAYEPSGDGDHVYVRFTKRNLTTDDAIRSIARALGVSERDAGAAGMKDKVGVTTQTISLQAPRGQAPGDLVERARALAIDGITVHDVRRHTNKLKPGHLEGNRFKIVVRGVDRTRVDEVRASLDRIAREGLPNHFGTQRFGRDGDNAVRARDWLTGKAQAPRDPRQRRFLWSSLQSAIFNAVLDARVADGTWVTAFEGDLLKRRTSGGLFLCTDVQADQPRAASGEVSATGPLVGVKMRSPEGAPAALETRVSQEILGDGFDLAKTKALGEGSRRALRLWVSELSVEVLAPENSGEEGASMGVYFVLPKGAYATTVLGAVVSLDSPLEPFHEKAPRGATAAAGEEVPRESE